MQQEHSATAQKIKLLESENEILKSETQVLQSEAEHLRKVRLYLIYELFWNLTFRRKSRYWRLASALTRMAQATTVQK